MKVPLSSVDIGDAERQAVLQAIDKGELSSAVPAVHAFEAAMARATQRTHAIAANSGTSAIELVLTAMGVGPGDDVIVPALTFAAPALAVARLGARPVFADVDASWTICVKSAAKLTSSRTKAIIAVDLLGHPCDYDALNSLGLPIIEDAAEAFGARYKSAPVGAFGVAAIFSFHANKVISAGEGGCIVCDDEKLTKRMRQLNAFGMDPDRRYWHVDLGCNWRMNGLVAAVALAQLERAEALMAGRAAAAARYDQAFAGSDLERRPVADWAQESMWLYTLASEHRDAILAQCYADGIDARAIWPALPHNPVFADAPASQIPNAARLAAQAFWLPTFSTISPEQCDAVIDAVRGAMKKAAR